MPSHGQGYKSPEEVQAAYHEALRGGAVGAARWGLVGAVASGAAWHYSPIYRKLTIQFKVFLQLSVMILGGVIEADWRMQRHELAVRENSRRLKYHMEELRRKAMYQELQKLEAEEAEWKEGNK